MAKSVLEELVTILGFEIDDDEAKEYAQSVENVKNGMKRLLQASAAAAAGLTAFITVNQNANDELVKFSRTIDATVGEVQRLIHAGRILGASDGDIMSSLTNLNRLASEAHRGIGSGVEIFGLLGMSADDANGRIKPVTRLIGEVADRIKALDSAAEQAEFAQKLGISDRAVLLLKAGREEIGALGAELDSVGAILSPEQQRTAEAFGDAMVRGRAVLRGWANDIASILAPALSETVNAFFEWAQANREVIKSEILEWVTAFKNTLPAIAIFLGIIAAILTYMFWPVVAGALAIAAVSALVVDLISTFFGLDTVTRRVFEGLKTGWINIAHEAKEAIDKLVGYFREIPSRIAEYLPDLSFGGVFDFGGGFGGFGTPAAAGAGGASPGAVSNTTVNQSPTVIINGPADEREVKRAVKDALDEKAREVESHSANPVVG